MERQRRRKSQGKSRARKDQKREPNRGVAQERLEEAGVGRKVLEMSIGGSDIQQRLALNRHEGAISTFSMGSSGTVMYDYYRLLIAYKPALGATCYITQMSPEDIPSLDVITRKFQKHLAKPSLPVAKLDQEEDSHASSESQVDPAFLGTTMNVLCGEVPAYYI
ncbi:pulmonary surfactant-associated protein C isoform X2 [Gracilinanus agilis]|uniref:pulmonary surfactant-associated protein C isoform X2 n=1 Tax=Gracilinanus agilis TaxID=191870 RepID=UPI001CFF1559|nr:pulmonary surfactant-associated protein C isoform X2 [Gracilinanus agilis]